MSPRAFVCGCAGHALTERDRDFIREAQPWGLILFKRNVDSPDQVRRLVASFRDAVGRAEAPVMIDQEGGRVQRLAPPHWPVYPSAGVLGRLPDSGAVRRRDAVRLAAQAMARDLFDLGITIDCVPVLDVPAIGSHSVVGDRAYSADPEAVASLGRVVAECMLANGVLPVMKHLPGHGRGRVDSHKELPVVDADRQTLEKTDFLPFRALADLPAGMTAHVVYTAIDPAAPATTSATVVREVIRGSIGFEGLLFTDDLSMQALSGSLRQRAEAALRAGVDIVLHCNGDLAEAAEVAAVASVLAGPSEARAAAAMRRRSAEVEPFDRSAAQATLQAALAAGEAKAQSAPA